MSQDEIIELFEVQSQSPHCTDKTRRHKKLLPPIHDLQKQKHPHAKKSPSVSNKQKLTQSLNSEDEDIAFSDVTSDSHEVKNATSPVFPESTSKSEILPDKERVRERFNVVGKQASKSSHKHNVSSKLLKSDTLNEKAEQRLQMYKKNKPDERSDLKSIDTYAFFAENNIGNGAAHTHDEIIDNVSVTSASKLTDNQLVKYEPAEQFLHLIELLEDNLFWYPKSNTEILNMTWNNKEQRNLEEEGFYVPEAPKFAKRHLKILEHRLFDPDDCKWFNHNGMLNFLPNPKSNISTRLIISDNDKKIYEYIKACTAFRMCEEVVIHRQSILEFYVGGIQFKHHPLFSVEHVLEQKLLTLLEIYESKFNQHNTVKLVNRLEALRKLKLQSEMLVKESGDASANEEKKLCNYTEEIIKLRNRWFKEGKEKRDMTKNILEIWKSIKRIREQNNFSCTSIRLAIKKVHCDYQTEKISFERKVNETCKEIISEHLAQYDKDVEKYKHKLHEWKISKSKSHDNEEILLSKPKKPTKKFDEEQIKMDVIRMFNESFKAPGEPQIYFETHYDYKITENVENIKEKQRRNAVNASNIYLKIICDGVEISKTKTISFNNSFKCNFDESLSLQFLSVPSDIIIEIHEQLNTFLKRTYTHIKLPVPPQNVFFKNNAVFKKLFTKEEIVHYKHSGVGSGFNVTEIPELSAISNFQQDGVLNTEGIIYYNLGWDKNFNKTSATQDINKVKMKNLDTLFTKDGLINTANLENWTDENQIDPENPQNAALYEYIKMCSSKTYSTNKEYFRLNPSQKSLQLCSTEDLEKNIRFKVLQLRNQNVPEFSGMVVSNRIKEIPLNILHGFEQRRLHSMENYEPDDDADIDTIRSHGEKFLKEIFIKVFQHCHNTQNNLLFDDVVDEKCLAHFDLLVQDVINKFLTYFTFQSYGRNFFSYLTNRQIQTIPQETSTTASTRIEVCLLSGINICRKYAVVSSKSVNNVLENSGDIKSFVEVKHGHFSALSSTADGPNPVWNENLNVPLESLHTDYMNPNFLKGSVLVNLYKKIDNENVLIGYIEIPLSAICSCNKMEGLFKVKTPRFVSDDQDERSNKQLGKDIHSSSVAADTYLSIKILVRPSIPKLSPSMADWPTNELPYTKDHILNWNEALNNSFSHRRFSALVIDTNCKTSCVTRYIRPLEPPQLNPDGFDVTAEQCLRYVSLIPFTNCNKFYQTVCLTTDQFLRINIGSVVDHAIALTCYLLTLNLEAWLVFGFGIPYGVTAYVLTKEYLRDSQIPIYYIYDVVTACKYKIQDQFCPLQKVFCIINEYNIWANIQRDNTISNVRLDLTRRSDWSALFNNKIPAPSNSLQVKLSYSYNNELTTLEMRIETKIRKKMEKSRKMYPTSFNTDICITYKNILKKFEFHSLRGKSNSEIHVELNRTEPFIKVNGIVINLPYTSVSSIAAKALSFGVHNNVVTNAEFAVSVCIHAYPSRVLSVWVFVGCIFQNNLI